jgi:ribosomal protein L11 methyltransferase
MLLKVIIAGNRENADMISDFLMDRGALSITFEDGGSQALFQEQLYEAPLWRETLIQAFFDEDAPLDFIFRELKAVLGKNIDPQVIQVKDQDWVQLTQQCFPPQLFGNCLWVAPSWETTEPPPGSAVLRLNPGLGFGTGTHPTTSLCLDWLTQQDLKHKTVIDYGCGSGILGLAALALGAEKVWAVDHDPQALTATQNNAELNHFSTPALSIVLPEQLPPGRADIILANILANPLCELAPILISHLAPAGRIALSGFFAEEVSKISKVYDEQLQMQSAQYRETWAMLIYSHSE